MTFFQPTSFQPTKMGVRYPISDATKLCLRLLKLAASLCCLLSLSLPTYAEIYSWKDKNGNMHFSDKKIEGIGQKRVNIKVKTSEWGKYVIDINDVDGILTEQEKQRIQEDVNAVYQFFDRKLYFDIHKTVPVNIRLYEKKEDYQRYVLDTNSKASINSRGIYFPKTNEIALYLNPKERWRTFWTIKHETSHAIVDTVTPFVPSWLNEGLAENMEALGVNRNDFFLYPHRENHRNAENAHKRGNNLDVKKFLSLSSTKFYKQLKSEGSSHQTHAGELVRLFLSTKPGLKFVIRLIHIYERGARTYGSHLAKEHYTGGLKVLQNDWNRWVSRPESQKLKL